VTPREWIAALPFARAKSGLGRLSLVGGTLALTDDAIVFRPLMHLGRKRVLPLAEVTDVAAFAEKPPRLVIAVQQREHVFIVAQNRTTPVWNSDTTARDDAVAELAAAAASVSAAS
jgi:hypothetical protein